MRYSIEPKERRYVRSMVFYLLLEILMINVVNMVNL